MKKINKTNSQIRTEKEKLVMENFASVMKKLDATFLIESEVNEISDEKKKEHASDEYNRSDYGDSKSNCCGAKFVQGDRCKDCGEHASPSDEVNENEAMEMVDCPDCYGKGMKRIVYQGESEWDICDTCGGKKKMTRAHKNAWEKYTYGDDDDPNVY